MSASPIAIFAAGFIAGGFILGGVVAQARIVTLNSAIAGVLPNSEGSLFCVTATSVLRPITGTIRNTSVNAPGGVSYGVTMRCPA
ncbi:hypothetical protein [Falsiroseomonas sp.]|uniref:hypothetical protein n=1 Tax=Falsiroseomonas sp. TaxID=2870721 RepID=UPI00271A177C|nr:hypothetical protein [Falsiroseomonas sp.]MDO9501661.1 hypothetical protein [Falsiroseomonas sp.]MDP3416065.1 hypothetical protein [Falsiroseomonas sp.]